MSLRTYQQLTIAGVLTLGGLSAAGCDDDDGDGPEPVMDAGPDGGDGDGDGDGDAGPVGMECPAMNGMAETAFCESTPTDLGFPLDACCDDKVPEGQNTCGATIPMIPGSPLKDCMAKMQPGDASGHCGAFFDQVDTVGANDGAYTFQIGNETVSFPGCCTPTGLCGVTIDTFMLQGAVLNVGLGCVPLSRFAEPEPVGDGGVGDGGVGDGGMPEEITLSPFCVPDDADGMNDQACPPTMGFTLAGNEVNLCDELAASFAEAGLPVLGCDPSDLTPLWICAQRGLPLIEDGMVPTTFPCMDYVPEFVNGCGVGVDEEGCVPNVPDTVFGCVDIDAEGFDANVKAALLAQVPIAACGCGGNGMVGATCIPNVNSDVCGTKPTEVNDRGTPENAADDCLVDIPEYARGCGLEAEPTQQNPCVRRSPELFGCEEHTTGDVPNVPEYACGCGDDTVAAGCIPNVPNELCGAIEVTMGQVPGVANIACGCGDEVRGENCIPNVPDTVCGAIARCTEGEAGSGEGSATTCADGEVCVDARGGGGVTGDPAGDDIGDSCITPPPPT